MLTKGSIFSNSVTQRTLHNKLLCDKVYYLLVRWFWKIDAAYVHTFPLSQYVHGISAPISSLQFTLLLSGRDEKIKGTKRVTQSALILIVLCELCDMLVAQRKEAYGYDKHQS